MEGEHYFIDTLCQDLLFKPEDFGVIVTNNMFGDILSDLCAGLVGGVGLAASGCIHPGRVCMFEPVHGTAPDIALKGIANPLRRLPDGQDHAEHAGHGEGGGPDLGGDTLRRPREEGPRRTLGGSLNTREVGDYLCAHIQTIGRVDFFCFFMMERMIHAL